MFSNLQLMPKLMNGCMIQALSRTLVSEGDSSAISRIFLSYIMQIPVVLGRRILGPLDMNRMRTPPFKVALRPIYFQHKFCANHRGLNEVMFTSKH
jgi:hypothetical protein